MRGGISEGVYQHRDHECYNRVCHTRVYTNLFVQLAFVVGRRMRYGFTINVAMIEYVEIFEHMNDF